ncbi:MAG: 4-hydroxythreonine-4-phosphate dehydrogenase PdxA [Candidatus Aminicenantia bacterium]
MILPKIGVTLGDPGGIGPEVVLKALSSEVILKKAHYLIFGSSSIIDQERKNLRINFNIGNNISLIDLAPSVGKIKRGRPEENNGRISFLFFEKAVQEAVKGNIKAIVTAPISKKSWQLAGYNYLGHTNYLAESFPEAIMSFWSEELRVILYTTHLPLKEVVKKIKKKRLVSFIQSVERGLKKLGLKDYEFLIASLNPHAGEEGVLGLEENEEIVPAIKEAQKKGIKIKGPFSPDTIFLKAYRKPDKIVISLYHDQGLAPFKLIAFQKGVNFTLGLPFIRTSPTHGTGFEIAGQGIADPTSMIEAINLATKLSVSAFN